MSPTLILDLVIATLLLITIAYCWRLSGKISQLQEGKKDFANFIAEFNTSIFKAEENITQLKTLGEEVDITLRDQIHKARFLANDLSFLLEKGENLANSLEGYITSSRSFGSGVPSARKQMQPTLQPRMSNFAPPAPNPQESAMALTAAQIVQNLQGTKPVMTTAKKQALDDVLAQIAARKNQVASTQNPPVRNTPPVSQPKQNINVKQLAESLKTLQRVE